MNQTMKKRLDKLDALLPPPLPSLAALIEAGADAVTAAIRDGTYKAILAAASHTELVELRDAIKAERERRRENEQV